MAVSPDEGGVSVPDYQVEEASLVVEFGSSVGVAAIYLASTLGDQELRSIHRCGDRSRQGGAGEPESNRGWIGSRTEMIAGDARETLGSIAESIDILFLDCWKNIFPSSLCCFRTCHRGSSCSPTSVNCGTCARAAREQLPERNDRSIAEAAWPMSYSSDRIPLRHRILCDRQTPA